MRTALVVRFFPFLGHFPNLFHGREDVGIERLFQVALVEAFNERILVRLVRLDVADFDAATIAPVHEHPSAAPGSLKVAAHCSAARELMVSSG